MRSWIFSIITPVFSVTWSSEIILICWFAAQISYNYQCWKGLCCFIFLWKKGYFFRILWWIGISKEPHFFSNRMFCNILNVFTVTFDQCNASLLNKSLFLYILALGFGTEPQSFPKFSLPRLLSPPSFRRHGPVTYSDSTESSSKDRRPRITDRPYSIKRCQWTHTDHCICLTNTHNLCCFRLSTL